MCTYIIIYYVYDAPTILAITGGWRSKEDNLIPYCLQGDLDLVPQNIEPRYGLSERMIVMAVIWVRRYLRCP